MATLALTSGSWSIAYKNADRRTDTTYGDRVRFVNLKLSITGGAWPLTGVNLPAYGSVGLVRRLDGYIFNQSLYTMSGTPAGATVSGAILWQYTATANKLRALRVTNATGTSKPVIVPLSTLASPAKQTFYCTAFGW